MTNNALDARGGSESYLETVATELRKLGHEVSFYSATGGGTMADLLRDQGYPIYDEVADLPTDFDVIHGQHANAVGSVRTRLPDTPLVFVCHSWIINAIEDPVAELGAASLVAFNDLTLRRMRAHVAGAAVPVHRLTQPITVSFADGVRTPVSESPKHAVAVSRRMLTLPARLEAACAELGIDFTWVGGPGNEMVDARQAMLAADLVIGMGRTALEAMAASKPVLLMDESFNAGWVTEASYPAIEADGFTGLESPLGERDLVTLLRQYDARLGTVGRHLVVRHHLAQNHAIRLLEIYAAAADAPASARPTAQDASTIALLTADRFSLELRLAQAEWRAAGLQRDLEAARHSRDLLEQEFTITKEHVSNLEAELELVRSQRDRSRLRRQKAAAKLETAEQERDSALEQLAALTGRPVESADGRQRPGWLTRRRTR